MRISDDFYSPKATPPDAALDDKTPVECRASDKGLRLPTTARLPINRCNLPADILGGLTFQAHPTPLVLDGVLELHRPFFEQLDAQPDAAARAAMFRDYLTVQFRLDWLEEAGWTEASGRGRANWLRLLRGWSFSSDGLEGAALKGWVESRFGLLPRFHGEALHSAGDAAWGRYEEMRARALYGTNALEAQLDLVYAYCQYEAAKRPDWPAGPLLYRGINRPDDHEVLGREGRSSVLLFNSLTSFSASRERAGEFGDAVFEVQVPWPKLMFHCALLPGVLTGEDEYLVIGGLYRARRCD